jgi:uncharacterized membrane protein
MADVLVWVVWVIIISFLLSFLFCFHSRDLESKRMGGTSLHVSYYLLIVNDA